MMVNMSSNLPPLIFAVMMMCNQVVAFVLIPSAGHCPSCLCNRNIPAAFALKNTLENKVEGEDTESWNLDDTEIDTLFEGYDGYLDGTSDAFTPIKEVTNVEKAWRWARKPLLSIGGKGVTAKHGNSLRQLLNDHTAVKVKVNMQKFGTFQEAFETISSLTEEAGAPIGLELLHYRESDKCILFGMPGTLERIEKGEWPPPKAVREEKELTDEEDEDEEE